MANFSQPTKDIKINGEAYRITILSLKDSVALMRSTVLRGLVKAPFEITKENIETIPLNVLTEICDQIHALSTEVLMQITHKKSGVMSYAH